VWRYRLANGRCLAKEFLDAIEKSMQDKFEGQFKAVSAIGRSYYNRERFKPLQDKGKPLWEFKQFDHRLYCCRECKGEWVKIILLYGCVKQKSGKTKSENAEIATAMRIFEEYENTKGR
jgi:hypothetical protein